MCSGSVSETAFHAAVRAKRDRWPGKKKGNPCAAWAGRARADEFRPAHGGTSGSKSNLVGGGTKLDVFVLRSDYDFCERMTRPSADKCTLSRVESTANTLCQIFLATRESACDGQ